MYLIQRIFLNIFILCTSLNGREELDNLVSWIGLQCAVYSFEMPTDISFPPLMSWKESISTIYALVAKLFSEYALQKAVPKLYFLVHWAFKWVISVDCTKL